MGLSITSEFSLADLHGAAPGEADGGPDVRMLRLRSRAAANVRQASSLIQPGLCRFTVPGAGILELRRGRDIVLAPYEGTSPELIADVVLASGWGGLLQQRGEFALHGAVVRSGGGAVALCGAPGAGKSTAAAALARRGHPVISDDLSRMVVPAGARLPSVWGTSRCLRLSDDALAASGWDRSDLARAAAPEGMPVRKLLLPVADRRAGERPVGLRAVYVLEWGELGITRLRGSEALLAFLRAATYRPALLTQSELARHWEQATQVVRRLPVFRFSRPRDWKCFDQSIDRMAASL